MEDEPIEPEVVNRGFTFKTVTAPWLLLGVGALGVFGVGAVLALSFGWFFLVAAVYRLLWNYAIGPEATSLIYGAQSLAYTKALASVALLFLIGWLVSPKRS